MKPHMTTRQKYRRRRLNRILKRNLKRNMQKGLPVKWEYGMSYMNSVAQETLKQYEHLLD